METAIVPKVRYKFVEIFVLVFSGVSVVSVFINCYMSIGSSQENLFNDNFNDKNHHFKGVKVLSHKRDTKVYP